VPKPQRERILTGSTAVGAIMAGLLVLTGCDIANSDADREADQHADNAATVMARGLDPVAALQAAGAVVGDTGQTKIEALSADGTNWKGHLTLRITVQKNLNTLASQVAIRCYGYTFDHPDVNFSPDRMARCPSGPALAIPPPPSRIDLYAPAEVPRLARLLNSLSVAQRLDAGAVQHALEKAYPPPAVVWAARVTSTRIDMQVRSDRQCILATLPSVGPAQVSSPTHRFPCTGG
jgi:hypothetical protein